MNGNDSSQSLRRLYKIYLSPDLQAPKPEVALYVPVYTRIAAAPPRPQSPLVNITPPAYVDIPISIRSSKRSRTAPAVSDASREDDCFDETTNVEAGSFCFCLFTVEDSETYDISLCQVEEAEAENGSNMQSEITVQWWTQSDNCWVPGVSRQIIERNSIVYVLQPPDYHHNVPKKKGKEWLKLNKSGRDRMEILQSSV